MLMKGGIEVRTAVPGDVTKGCKLMLKWLVSRMVETGGLWG